MKETDIRGRYTIDDLGRLYEVGEDLFPSVSTVLDMRDTPEQLKQWKQRQNNYDAKMSFYQNRGTLIHAKCQEDIIPRNKETGEPVKEIWGKDERLSEKELKENGKYEEFETNMEWINTAWPIIKKVLNLPPNPDAQDDDSYNEVLDIETYVANKNIGYAGQFDILYHDDETNETVLADLKTAKSTYEKFQLQLAAYKMALPMVIDRMEVIRMNPDNRDWYISTSDEWERSTEDLQDEFIDLRTQLERQKLKTIVETIKDVDKEDDDVLYETMD